jgi:hypothetical protein
VIKVRSRETLTRLNTQTLIGYTSKRGQAWHYRADRQGSEPNHYVHAVPVADVRRPDLGHLVSSVDTAKAGERLLDVGG